MDYIEIFCESEKSIASILHVWSFAANVQSNVKGMEKADERRISSFIASIESEAQAQPVVDIKWEKKIFTSSRMMFMQIEELQIILGCH